MTAHSRQSDSWYVLSAVLCQALHGPSGPFDSTSDVIEHLTLTQNSSFLYVLLLDKRSYNCIGFEGESERL